MDTTHDEEKNYEVFSDRENSLSTETPPSKKSKYIPAQYLQRSNERNELIKKIQARNEQLLTREEEKLDEIDMFFRGLAITAKKFPGKGRIEAKKKIFAIMAELEEKYLIQEQPISQFQTIHQPHHLHIPSENMYLQSVSTNQSSPSTSVYSDTTSCSTFNLYNMDDATM